MGDFILWSTDEFQNKYIINKKLDHTTIPNEFSYKVKYIINWRNELFFKWICDNTTDNVTSKFDDHHNETIYFKNKDDAILFKLTWV